VSKKIAIVANTTWNIYNFRLNVIEELSNRGFEVLVIAPVDDYIEYKKQFPQVKHYALRSLNRNSRNPLKDILLTIELRRKYKRLKPDIVLHYTHKPNIFGTLAAFSLGIPSVSVVTGLGYAFIRNNLINKITTLLYKLSGNKAAKMIFENEDDRQFFIDKRIISAEKAVAVKGCGVNLSYFYPYPNGQIKRKTTFTYIGRLLYDKGILEFVEAARVLAKQNEDVEFWVIGELDDNNPSTVREDDVLEWVNNDIIKYYGFVRDVRPLISKSDCIVLPSYREGLPRIVIEAMAMAKPIITTQTPGCRETVDEGRSGYLVPSKDILGLTKAMNKFKSLSYEEKHIMGNNGRLKAEREFDDKKIALKIVDLIQEIEIC
jgi:glycosyltransferase involved in cell wall biosynthesis